MCIVTRVEERIREILLTGQDQMIPPAVRQARTRVLHLELLRYLRSVTVEDLYALPARDKRTVANNLLLNKYTSMFNRLTALSVNLSAVVRNDVNRYLQDWRYLLKGNDESA